MSAQVEVTSTSTKLLSFVALLDAATDKWYADNYPKSVGRDARHQIVVGPRYIRIVREQSCCGFVDRETGDIYYPASYQGPGSKKTRRVRGNIYDADNGAKCVRWYGVARADDMATDKSKY